ncbi:phosphotransferase [Leucobacter sp. cx-328]|uniref:phosphotransferase n=1 Tax=unclassified Leucobacter TaxID=2621730 RepID=UPI00165E68AC|nr:MULTISPECIES: phosphotransferase [unclassified Leucobacter]MBC9944775.1 phosphotransferase [Leucobacter sp. cx-328]
MAVDTIAPNSLALTPAEVDAILVSHYGVGSLGMQPLPSELSAVYRVALADGRDVAFKAIHFTEDDHALAQWRISAMDHLQDLGIPAGRTIPSLAGESTAVADSPAGPVIAHVGEWLSGVPLEAIPLTPELLRVVGATGARAALALAEWPQPPAAVSHPWELVRTLDSLDTSMASVTDPHISALLTRARELYAIRVAPVIDELPRAVVHHDMHDSNLLIDADRGVVSGVLDFGDMVFGPRIADLAITAGYACRRAADPVVAFIDVASGWGSVWALGEGAEGGGAGASEGAGAAAGSGAGAADPFTETEVDVLFASSIGRLAVNLSIWTARSASDRGDYARARSASTARALELLIAADLGEVDRALREALVAG